MAHAERIQILTSAEESELYGPPNLSVYEQRFLFSFDDMEINRIYRYQECLQRIADGFIHHVRQVKARAKGIAKEQVYQDWQKAARNLGKAADVLQLFRYLSNLMKSFEHQGKDNLTETIKCASPVAWQNINLNGKYLFAEGGETLDIEYLMAPIEDYMPVPEKY